LSSGNRDDELEMQQKAIKFNDGKPEKLTFVEVKSTEKS
jgi:hypothetical protein